MGLRRRAAPLPSAVLATSITVSRPRGEPANDLVDALGVVVLLPLGVLVPPQVGSNRLPAPRPGEDDAALPERHGRSVAGDVDGRAEEVVQTCVLDRSTALVSGHAGLKGEPVVRVGVLDPPDRRALRVESGAQARPVDFQRHHVLAHQATTAWYAAGTAYAHAVICMTAAAPRCRMPVPHVRWKYDSCSG